MTISPAQAKSVPASTVYAATRLTYDSGADFEQTRARFDERVPLLDPSLTTQLVIAGASWAEVEAAVDKVVGPTGFVAVARVDQGALFSLNGDRLDATLYLVGNPLIARQVTALEPAAALYAPFRVAIYRDATGTHIAYDQPSSVFKSLGSPGVDAIAVELDEKIRTTVEDTRRSLPVPTATDSPQE